MHQLPEQCDDGNVQDGDGCSSTCAVETDFVCEPNPAPSTFNSLCFYTGTVNINIDYIEKVSNANQINIVLDIQPSTLAFWDSVDFASIISIANLPISNIKVSRTADGKVSLVLDYSADVQNAVFSLAL